jgi:hypothetical protein
MERMVEAQIYYFKVITVIINLEKDVCVHGEGRERLKM